MKRLHFFCALLALCVMPGFLSAQAETVTPYTESFNNLTLDPPEDFMPPRWERIVDSWTSSWGDTEYVDYENPATGGVDGGAYLKAGSQKHLDDSWIYVKSNDILITPALTGEVSFYLFQPDYNDPNVQVYAYTLNTDGKGYTQGDLLKEYTSAEITQEWKQFSLTVEAGTYLGFRLEYVGIDELQAASAEIVLRKSIKIASATLTSDKEITADTENKFKVSFDFTVTNNGDYDLTAGEEGYSVSIINQSDDNEVVATKEFDFPLAKGATSAVLNIEADIDAGMEQRNINFALQENLRGRTAGSTSVNVLPYTPQLVLCLPDKTDEIVEPIDFGIVADKAAQGLRIMNNGGAPLNVTHVALPEGYTIDVDVPFSVPAQGEKEFTLTLNAGTGGDKAGNITFTADVIGEKSYQLAGIVPEADRWFENFENGEVPANMIFEDNWKIADSPAGLGAAGNTAWAENSEVGSLTKIISPLLNVQEGDVLTFFAGRQDYQTVLNVYYSSDRTDWKPVKTITGYGDGENEFTNDNDPDVVGTTYNIYAFKRFTVNDIPAGNWYIAFESGNARLDDIYGYQPADVEHDWYVTSSNLPDKATVNNAYNAVIAATNMNSKAESAGTYTATLYFNGEAVAEAETGEWTAGESKTFNFAYTPHEAGTYTAYIEIAAGDYAVQSAETTVTVSEEQAINEVTVGNAGKTESVAFNLTYNNSGSETIYTKDKLGLGDEAKITSLAFLGYASAPASDVHVTVWIENTTDTRHTGTTPRDTEDMTLVYDGTLTIEQAGSESEYMPIINLSLDEPFVYTGENLRITTKASIPNWSYTVSFAVEPDVTDCSIYYASDDENITWSWSSSLPVIRLTTEKEVSNISGKVTDNAGYAVAEAVITLTSGEVIYHGTTDTEGAYSIDVYQAGKEYEMTVAKKGYQTVVETVSFSEGNVVKNITLVPDKTTGIAGLTSGTLVLAGEGHIRLVTPVAGEAVVYSLTGVLVDRCHVAIGSNELPLPTGSYVVEVNGGVHKVLVR